MPFIDMSKINELNWYLEENIESKKYIDIVTLEENKEFLLKTLRKDNRIKIITLENNKLLEGEGSGGIKECKEK